MSSQSKPRRPRPRYRAGLTPPRRNRGPGSTAVQASDYCVAVDLPERVPITESEIRAVVLLLGSSLKELLSTTPTKALKHRAK